MELRMKEPYEEGLANHSAPSFAVGAVKPPLKRKQGERWAGYRASKNCSEESDSGAVPMNRLNKDGKPSAEGEEGRPLVKENTHQSSTHSTLSEARVSQGLAGVRKAAKERKGMQFTALLHHLTV